VVDEVLTHIVTHERMNLMGVNVLNEYKQHNELLMEQVKEKNKENNELRRKVEHYEEALKFIAGEHGTVYADSFDEAIQSALKALQGY
jgi:hypothetical protein